MTNTKFDKPTEHMSRVEYEVPGDAFTQLPDSRLNKRAVEEMCDIVQHRFGAIGGIRIAEDGSLTVLPPGEDGGFRLKSRSDRSPEEFKQLKRSQNSASEPRALSVTNAAKRLGVSSGCIYNMVRRKELRSHRIGKLIRIPIDAVEEKERGVRVSSNAGTGVSSDTGAIADQPGSAGQPTTVTLPNGRRARSLTTIADAAELTSVRLPNGRFAKFAAKKRC